MAYGRRSYRSSRRRYPRRRYGARKTRSRFSRKRFYKYSNRQRTVVRPNVLSREVFVKLPWSNVASNLIISGGANSVLVALGSSPVGTPQSLASVTPTAGDVWASGISEYAAFFNKYRILGASIKVSGTMTLSGQSGGMGVVLIPVTAGGPETGTPANAVAERVTELNALTYAQLCTQPYAQSKLIGVADSGNSTFYFKMFRKTKHMIACKDVVDNDESIARLPDVNGQHGGYILNSRTGWFYYFRAFNLTVDTELHLNIQVKMKYYAQLSGRTNWVPITVP